MKRNDLKVPVDKLRYQVDLESLGFQHTSEIAPIKNFVGQKRAVDALRFGLEIESPGYNVVVTGLSRSGRSSLVRQESEKIVKKLQKQDKLDLKDICYIYNFDSPDKPRVLVFKAGQGSKFKRKVRLLLAYLKREIKIAFQHKSFVGAKERLINNFYRRADELDAQMMAEIKKEHFILQQGVGGSYNLNPMSLKDEGVPISVQEFSQLPPDIQKQLQKTEDKLIEMVKETKQQIYEMEQEMHGITKRAEEMLFIGEVERIFKKLKFSEPQVQEYINQLEMYVLDHMELFKPEENIEKQIILPTSADKIKTDPFLPFKINLLVDNSKTNSLPVKFEEYPSFNNLFGQIGKKVKAPLTYSTNHTMIMPGALIQHRYLILRMRDLLLSPGVWPKLKKTLKTGFLKFEDSFDSFGFNSTSLRPDPIPINVKVIIISEPDIYNLLVEHDPNFLDVFKTRTEFDYEMNRTNTCLKSYASFISFCCDKEKLLPFEKSAVAQIIEYGIRLADDQKKLSTRFGKIKDLIIESDYWARKSKGQVVKDIHVEQALKKKRQRINLRERKYQENVRSGKRLITTRGKKIGQINALPVSPISEDFSFGSPVRITARSYLGKNKVISVQRNVKLSGPSYNKGVDILTGYINGKYGGDKYIPLSFTICFEQLYGPIDGDSASVAELLVILSELADLPIDQRYAVTGSMNQKGEVQPVGGINQKIEGFFDVCKKKGLSGAQGVFIPVQNVDNLMLDKRVLKAGQSGKFYVYYFSTIDELIELMFNIPARDFDQLVNTRIKEANHLISRHTLEQNTE